MRYLDVDDDGVNVQSNGVDTPTVQGLANQVKRNFLLLCVDIPRTSYPSNRPCDSLPLPASEVTGTRGFAKESNFMLTPEEHEMLCLWSAFVGAACFAY